VHEGFENETDLAVISILFDATKDIESGLLGKLKLSSLALDSNGTLALNTTRAEQLKVPLMQYV